VASVPCSKRRITAALSSTSKPRCADDVAACTDTTSPARGPSSQRSWSMSWIRLISTGPPPGWRRQARSK
jgi:hypothetical protein